VEAVGRELVRRRQVDERRQLRARLDHAGLDELRHPERLHARRLLAGDDGAGIDPGEDAIGRTEVDADHVACVGHATGQPISTSAGAMIFGSSPVREGIETPAARQPVWRSVPVNGGSPGTVPVSGMAAGPKPAGTVTASSSRPASTGSSLTQARSALAHAVWMPRVAAPICSSE